MIQKKAPITRLVRCPNCQKNARYDISNEFRPFCSDRCKNADIASWAEEKYQIPGPATLDVNEDIHRSNYTDDEDQD